MHGHSKSILLYRAINLVISNEGEENGVDEKILITIIKKR